jgi:hypothetical protein
MTPRRAMDGATMKMAAGYGNLATDVPAYAAEEVTVDGATSDVVLGVETTECCRGTSQTEACHKQLITIFGTWHTGVNNVRLSVNTRQHTAKCWRDNHPVKRIVDEGKKH